MGGGIPSEAKTKGLNVSFLFFSDYSLEIMEQLALYEDFHSQSETVNAFFEPIYVPIRAKEGGFGHLLCYSTLDSLIYF